MFEQIIFSVLTTAAVSIGYYLGSRQYNYEDAYLDGYEDGYRDAMGRKYDSCRQEDN